MSYEEARAGPVESVPGTEINFNNISKKHHFLTGEKGVFGAPGMGVIYRV